MRRLSLVALALFLITSATAVRAQVVALPGTGCEDGAALGGELISVDGQPPAIGNLTFGLQHTCPFGSQFSLFTMGPCFTGPATNWNLADPCFGAWTMLPATCRMGWQMPNLLFLDGAPVRQDGKVTLAFPIPNLPLLVGQNVCVQFLCGVLNSPTPCTGISQGVSVTFM